MLLETSAGGWLERLKWYWPAFLALLVMLPRLASPQFGLLDDGVTVITSRALLEQPGRLCAVGDSGRFRPAFELYYGLLYWIAWDSSLFYYLANTAVLLLTVVLFVRILKRFGVGPWAASGAAILFNCSTPAIENYYTLSKCEPLQLFFALLAIESGARAAQATARRTLAAWASLCTLSALLCALSKETGVALVLVALMLGLVKKLPRREGSDSISIRASILLFGAPIMAVIGFLLLWKACSHIEFSQGWYTRSYSLSARRLVGSAITCSILALHACPYLPVLVVHVAYGVIRHRLSLHRMQIYTLAWMVAWIAILLPWPSPLAYHLLPFLAGAAAFSAVALAAVMGSAAGRQSTGTRGLVVLVLLLAGTSFLNSWTAARMQLAIDQANSDLLNYLAHLPRNSKAGFLLAQPNEYVFEAGVHLATFKGRQDIEVSYSDIKDVDKAAVQLNYWVVPYMSGQLIPSVRCAVNEPDARLRNAKLEELPPGQAAKAWQVRRSITLFDVGLHRVLCWFVGPGGGVPCWVPRPLLEAREFVYGWTVYRLAVPRDRRQP